MLRFFDRRSADAFAASLETTEVVEIHADDQEEKRDDISILFERSNPYCLILREGLLYCVIVRCGKDDADFRLENQDGSILYVGYFWHDEEIVEFGSRSEALAWLRNSMITVYHVFTDNKDLWTKDYRFARKLYDHWKKTRSSARLYRQVYEDEEGMLNDEMIEEDCLMGYGDFPW